MTEERPRVRALLVDAEHRYVLIERRKPGKEPYLVLPGGGVATGESKHDALRRELMEELGATVEIGEAITPCESTTTIYRCTLVSLDPSLRHGPEFEDDSRGSYEVRRYTKDDLCASTAPLYPDSVLTYL